MNTPRDELPEPKINILKVVKLRENQKKEKKEKPCKYLDHLYKKNDAFLRKYFEEK